MTQVALRRIWRAIDGPKPCVDPDCCRRPNCRASAYSWLIHHNERHGLDFRGVDPEEEIEMERDPDLLTLKAAAPLLRGDEVIWIHRTALKGTGIRGEFADGGAIDLATGTEEAPCSATE